MAAEVLAFPSSYDPSELAVTSTEIEAATDYQLTVLLIVQDRLAAASNNRGPADTTFGHFLEQAGFDRTTGNSGQEALLTSYTPDGNLIHIRPTAQVEANPLGRISGRPNDQLVAFFRVVHASLETGVITDQVVPAQVQTVYGRSVLQLDLVRESYPYGLETLPVSDNPLQMAIDQRRQQLKTLRHQPQLSVIMSTQGCDLVVNGTAESLEPLANQNGIWPQIAALEKQLAGKK